MLIGGDGGSGVKGYLLGEGHCEFCTHTVDTL